MDPIRKALGLMVTATQKVQEIPKETLERIQKQQEAAAEQARLLQVEKELLSRQT